MHLPQGVRQETGKRGSTLPRLGGVPFRGISGPCEDSLKCSVAKSAKRSVLETTKPATQGYSHEAIVWVVTGRKMRG